MHVLRKRVGDSFNASDGRGELYYATVERIDSRSCLLRLQHRGPLEWPFPSFILFQCLPKGKKFDQIVRQSVELGVSKIVPVVSRYSVPKWQDPENKIKRLKRIAREAAQQSGASEVPEIFSPFPLQEVAHVFSPNTEERLGLFFHQAPLAPTYLHRYLSVARKEIALVIGPEGGLAKEETEFLQEAGFSPVYLGPKVLRTETAPIFAIAAIEIILLEKEAWKV